MEIVRLLLKHGAKVEETNENGHTPLVNVLLEEMIMAKLFFLLLDGSCGWWSCGSNSNST